MKALTLWQPWASAIATGAKTIETRHWSTSYRGQLAIHAARRKFKYELIEIGCWGYWCAALGITMGSRYLGDILPFGAIVAVCTLVDCKSTESFTQGELDTHHYPPFVTAPTSIYTWTERMMGDFSLGRFGWVLRDIKPLPEPIPYRGQQGLFQIPDEEIK